MQETVTTSGERKSLFSSFLEVLEAREKQAQRDRELQEERYLRRTQRIYDLHDRQRREASELRRCLDFLSQYADVLESIMHAHSTVGVPMSATILRHTAAVQRNMVQCIANATRIRHLLHAAYQPQMDTILAKMEAELNTTTAIVQGAVDATYKSEVTIENLQNIIAEQKRRVRELSSSAVFTSLCGGDSGAAAAETEAAEAEAEAGAEAAAAAEAGAEALSPLERRPASGACSTPIAKD